MLCFGGAAAIPVIYVERSCVAAPSPQVAPASSFKIGDGDYRRAEGDSFLSYPEWYIVHAYTDLAGVTSQSSESAFDYLASIRQFWSSLCRATEVAARIGAMTDDQKTTNYVIGISFTAEMGFQGLYERSIGALTVWTRGDKRTAEDAFNLQLLQTYAAFLNQTPWYQFPFGSELLRFWRETPFTFSVRGMERRFALSLQYATKSAYAALIRYAASYAPADLTIKSVVTGLEPSQVAADSKIRRIRDVESSDGTRGTLIETPRYQEFTEIVRRWGEQPGVTILEIAGNHRILTTVNVPSGKKLSLSDATEIFSLPIQSKPGWLRIGLDTPVTALVSQASDVAKQGAQFEHAYDY